jgi:TPR repeat protein
MPIATDGPLPTAGEMRSAIAAASSEPSKAGASGAAHALPAADLVAESQEAPKLDPSALMARGDEFLRQSDVTSARLFYRLAAVNGSAAGAMAMGSTYDPVLLERNAVRGVKPDPGKALEWYRRAVELGDPGGKTRSAELLEMLRVDAARGDPQAQAILEKATK